MVIQSKLTWSLYRCGEEYRHQIMAGKESAAMMSLIMVKVSGPTDGHNPHAGDRDENSLLAHSFPISNRISDSQISAKGPFL